MNVIVNGVQSMIDQSATLTELMEQFALPHQGVAIAVNAEIVRRGMWATTTLHEGDRIEVVTAAAGG